MGEQFTLSYVEFMVHFQSINHNFVLLVSLAAVQPTELRTKTARTNVDKQFCSSEYYVYLYAIAMISAKFCVAS